MKETIDLTLDELNKRSRLIIVVFLFATVFIRFAILRAIFIIIICFRFLAQLVFGLIVLLIFACGFRLSLLRLRFIPLGFLLVDFFATTQATGGHTWHQPQQQQQS